MTDQMRQRCLTRLLPGDVEPELDSIAHAAGRDEREWYQAQERARDVLIGDLQECICELLIKNQQLRWLLESERSKKREEFKNV